VIPVLYEDDALMVVDKPAGITVNKAETTKGQITVQDTIEENWPEPLKQKQKEYLEEKRSPAAGTLIDSEADFYLRAGIVHRLDKETSGCLLIAKTQDAFSDLQRQFKERLVKKTYKALAHGKVVPNNGEISVPVGRLPWNRNKFGIVPGGRDSKTGYQVISYYTNQINKEILTYLELTPLTGRTHQIRVHLQYIGHPVFADFLYAGRKTQRADRRSIGRVFLHASTIAFTHPVTGKAFSVESLLPAQLQAFLETLKKTD
jgi:23S rRNA pseudouridine1911/1915/1917 synthase